MKVFSKEKWLQSANGDLAAGIITQGDIDNACATWVAALHGKTQEEIAAQGETSLREEWFTDVTTE